jgi:predicted TIM-barrel fold metal-dependent hydrolase
MLPLITLEEHYLSESALKWGRNEATFAGFPGMPTSKLLSLGSERLNDMDKGQIRRQILSHGPLIDEPPLHICQEANDGLAEAVRNHSDRFAGLAFLPMNNPLDAAAELGRCVTELGFIGTLVPNHVGGRFYDGDEFWPLFAKAQELDVPIYLHPTWASDDMTTRYTGNFTKAASVALGQWGWGWHSETGLHVLKLFSSGLFDRFPRLKIIIGHDGEMLPFMMDRILRFSTAWGERERDFKEVWDHNIWVTTSGMFTLPPFSCLLQTTKVERILFSIDYPFENIKEGSQFIKLLEDSGIVSDEQLQMIGFRNAEKLFRLTK